MLSHKSKPFANESLRSTLGSLQPGQPLPLSASNIFSEETANASRARTTLRLSALSPASVLAPTDGADGDETQWKREAQRLDLTRGTDDPSVNRPQAAAALHLHSTPSNASTTGRRLAGWRGCREECAHRALLPQSAFPSREVPRDSPPPPTTTTTQTHAVCFSSWNDGPLVLSTWQSRESGVGGE